MIRLGCPHCGRRYELDDQWAGVQVRCDVCGARFVVPRAGYADPIPQLSETREAVKPSSSSSEKIVISFDEEVSEKAHASSASPGGCSQSSSDVRRLSPRQRRLHADWRLMQRRFSSFPYIHLVEATGEPPERYVIEYNVKGIERMDGDRIVLRHSHRVEIVLPGTYPRTPPVCRMLTPIFHPNIEPAVICIGDHWTAAEVLCDLVVRIGEIITYQSYNIKSPLDGEAAMWADLHEDMLPIDSCDLMPPEE